VKLKSDETIAAQRGSSYLNRAKIRQLRLAKGLTMQAAGEAAGFGSTYAKVRWEQAERGRRMNVSLATAVCVAKGLGVSLTDLILPEPQPSGD
jgi:transcriptional regulator with XRE-family HTH domain